jgi:hypothetical protein
VVVVVVVVMVAAVVVVMFLNITFIGKEEEILTLGFKRLALAVATNPNLTLV